MCLQQFELIGAFVAQSSRRQHPVEHLITRGKSSYTFCRKSWVFSVLFGFLLQGKTRQGGLEWGNSLESNDVKICKYR